MAELPEILAVPGAHFLQRRHQPATASGGKEIPDYGEDVETTHEGSQRKTSG